MPVYRFQCQCGFQFEARKTVARHMEPSLCPDCGLKAERLMPTNIEGHFNKSVDGPGPQNTGIHDLDTNIDRVIGQSSAQNKEFMEARSREKRDMIRKNNLDPKRLARLPDGSYVQNSEEEQQFALRANVINSRAMGFFKQRKDPTQ